MSDLINRQDAINVMCNKGQIMTATSNTVVSDTVQIPVMDGTTERLSNRGGD